MSSYIPNDNKQRYLILDNGKFSSTVKSVCIKNFKNFVKKFLTFFWHFFDTVKFPHRWICQNQGVENFFKIFSAHWFYCTTKFHQLLGKTTILLSRKNLTLSYNAPLACYLNPIEEFFSYIASLVEQKLNYELILGNYCPTTLPLIEIVKNVILQIKENDFPFQKVFARAAILPSSIDIPLSSSCDELFSI